jgi:hypothetical protein
VTSDRARALADFFHTVAPRLLAELEASAALAGADPAAAAREWQAVALHACVRGVVSDDTRGASEAAADLVDDFHDAVLARLAGGEDAAWRARLAARYAEYDGLARTLGQKGAAKVPGAVARAAARHMGAPDPPALGEVLAPLLEALAEGAAATVAGAAPGDARAIHTPPVEGLRAITARLDGAGLAWGLGGSGLLAALGLVDHVNDWDVQVEAGPDVVRALYPDLPHTFHGHGGCHADWKLSFAAERTELIPRFAFFVPGGVVRVTLQVSGTWRGIPIASPEGWACAYALMGELDEPGLRARRAERAERLFAHLARAGADRARVAALFAEPLPEALAARLRALPVRTP